MPYTISKAFKFSYGHRLIKDAGKCGRLHGHTAKAIVFLKANDVNEAGMVYHFDDLKNTLGAWISENLDHRMLLEKNDPAVEALKSIGEDLVLIDFSPTAENLAKMLFNKSKEMKLPVEKVEVWESETAKACYYE